MIKGICKGPPLLMSLARSVVSGRPTAVYVTPEGESRVTLMLFSVNSISRKTAMGYFLVKGNVEEDGGYPLKKGHSSYKIKVPLSENKEEEGLIEIDDEVDNEKVIQQS